MIIILQKMTVLELLVIQNYNFKIPNIKYVINSQLIKFCDEHLLCYDFENSIWASQQRNKYKMYTNYKYLINYHNSQKLKCKFSIIILSGIVSHYNFFFEVYFLKR